jgi:hypothetical protein
MLEHDKITITNDQADFNQKVTIQLTLWSRIKILFTGRKTFIFTNKRASIFSYAMSLTLAEHTIKKERKVQNNDRILHR